MIPSQKSPLLVVGSVALDSVETPFGKKEEVVGGSATFFSAAASFFCPVQLVAVVGEDFPAAQVDFLVSRGVDLKGLSRAKGKTFRWKGKYSHQLNEAQTLDTQLNVFQDFAPALPAEYRNTEYVFLGNIHPDLQGRVLDQVTSPKWVGADTMNFWIRGESQALKRTLKRVNQLFINDGEARELAGEHNIVRAGRAIQAMGPSRVAIKRGEYGAILFDRDQLFACPALPLLDVLDPTGAGDSFAGGFMGHLAETGSTAPRALREGMGYGTTLASFTVSQFSVDGLRQLTRPQIESRYSELKDLTRFEGL